MAIFRVCFGCLLFRTAACLLGPQWIQSECVLGAKFSGPPWLQWECVLGAAFSDRYMSFRTAMDAIRMRFRCWIFRTAMAAIRVRFWCCFHGPRHVFPDRTGSHCFASYKTQRKARCCRVLSREWRRCGKIEKEKKKQDSFNKYDPIGLRVSNLAS